jgi:hypothetical protein
VNRFRVYARRELVFLALATMEACVVTPLVTVLLTLVTPLQPSSLSVTLVFFSALLAVHYVARLGMQAGVHVLLRSGLLGLGMLISGLLAVHRLLHAQTSFWSLAWLADVFRGLKTDELSLDVVVFVSVLFVWWRGLVLAQRRLDSGTVVSRFRAGVVMLAVTTMVSGVLLPSPSYQFVFAFFFVSLLGIALARAEEVGQQYGGSQSPFGPGWLAMVGGASVGVLVLAAGVATLLTGENISRLLGPIWDVQRVIFTYLLYAILFVLSWVGRSVIGFLESIFGELDVSGIGIALSPPDQAELGAEAGESPFTPEQLATAKATGIVLGVLFVLLLVAFSLRRLRARNGRRRDEDRESVWEGVNVRRSLRDLLDDGRRRLGEMSDALGHSRLGQIFAALTIRRIYAHVSALAAEQGHPRAPHETPYEYRPALKQAFPDNHEDVERITQAYVSVHYGEVPDQLADLKAIQAAWDRVRETTHKNSRSSNRQPDAPAS